MATVRPTKKQRELLRYIEQFIAENGYSPSYREIMKGCDYSSVATVAVHINNLIARGHLKKRDNSARSLEVTVDTSATVVKPQVKITAANEKWLIDIIENKFSTLENATAVDQRDIDQLYVITGALTVLGFDGAAVAFKSRLKEIEG